MDKGRFLGRDYLTMMDYEREEIQFILDTAIDLKAKLRRGEKHEVFRGLSAMMIFEKLSTRTRISFQAACAHLGMHSFFTMPAQLQMGRGEPIKDTARVIDRYCDVLFMRTFEQERVEEFAQYMQSPVINALTDMTHPCQGLADLQTILEHNGHLEGIKLSYAGDVYNVAQTLMVAGTLFDFDVWVARPSGYDPAPRVMEYLDGLGISNVHLTDSLEEAIQGADVVYANTWHSMGGPEMEKEKRIQDFAPFQINEEAMKLAKDDAVFMHCLPGYRGEEMTDGVIEGPQSVVFEQAENRMHTEKAVLYLTLGEVS
jgi:ornithine carbamoyltransferase